MQKSQQKASERQSHVLRLKTEYFPSASLIPITKLNGTLDTYTKCLSTSIRYNTRFDVCFVLAPFRVIILNIEV